MPLDGIQLGHYRLIRLIGSGGMGEVYQGEDIRIARQVAIKVVRTETAMSASEQTKQEAERLFQREMHAIALLDHPHILPLYDFGEEEVQGAKLTYMVMPFRAEGSLNDWLRKRDADKPLAPQDVAHILDQAASALQDAHDHQIVHQDVKPSNFLLRNADNSSNRPNLLLADFGIAKFLTSTTAMSQSIRGTPVYMAPEQWEGHPVPATGQYALGIMTYQLLIGRVPFSGRLEQLMHQHFYIQPQPPSRINTQLSPTLDAVLLRALAKKPEERFASISAFAHAFQHAIHNTELATSPMPTDQHLLTSPVILTTGPTIRPISRSKTSHDNLANSNASASATISTSISPTSDALQASNQKKFRFPAFQLFKISPLKRFLFVSLALLVILAGTIEANTIYQQQAIQEERTNATATAANVTPEVTLDPDQFPAYLSGPTHDHGSLTITFFGDEWPSNSKSASGGSCQEQYENDAYDVTYTNSGVYHCTGTNDFSNFAAEVQMTLVRGDCGGITFRNTSANSNYFFEVCTDGSYRLLLYSGGTQPITLLEDISASIQKGSGKLNTIAVKADRSAIYLYINHQPVNSTTDTTLDHGNIGFSAARLLNLSEDTSTKVTYTNIRIWTL